MNRRLLCVLIVTLVALPSFVAEAQTEREAKIQSAMSAALPSISETATIKDWPSEEGGEMVTLREGDPTWTCLPDNPETSGNDPMCLDEPWLTWAQAWMNKEDVTIDRMGFGYMLQGGTPESNVDPYATEQTPENEWISETGPHIMIILPDNAMLEGLPTDPDNGGPWLMWKGTPYAHVMVPTPRYDASSDQLTRKE